jgi:negative regulator of flagellin synthesis FlgM
MPDIGPVGLGSPLASVHSVSRVSFDSAPRAAASTGTARTEMRDRVELSDHARMLDRLRSMPAYRADKVAEARAAIESGTYESPARLQAAIEKLMGDLEA